MTQEGHHQAFEKAVGVMVDELMWTPISGIKDSCVVAHLVKDCEIFQSKSGN